METLYYIDGLGFQLVSLRTYLARKRPIDRATPIAWLSEREKKWLADVLKDDKAVEYLIDNLPKVTLRDHPRRSVAGRNEFVKNIYDRYLTVPNEDWFIFSLKFGERLRKRPY